MDLGDIPLFAMLRSRLGYLSQRQQVIAQNVANADTPGFAAQDLRPFTFSAKSGAQAMSAASGVTATQPGHMLAAGGRRPTPYKPVKAESFETTLDGNAVSLEEEMMKMTDARMSYDAAISFYQKSLDMIRLASRAPGKS